MKTLSILFFLLIGLNLSGQHLEKAPQREFRGVWIATVLNIDYPRSPTTNSIAQQEQWKNLLDNYQDLGFNAVIVQIRPAADALYPSKFAPWSKYLTGEQGHPPDSDYDPLDFMIKEAHKRSMEFHAWFNPYRATMNLDSLNLAQNHIIKQRPDWVLRYGSKYYLNPALPDVRNYLVDIVMEVVDNYDIDAVHFDDYFYPYQIQGEAFPDSLDYVFYGNNSFKSIEDWRRNNVDQLIEKLSMRIKESKGHVKFGISPFGVWRNQSNDPKGSATRAGATSYDHLYADVLKWLRRGWIDYIAPQIYWNVGFEPADYSILLNWWSRQTFEPHLYVGHAAYKVNTNAEPAWWDPNEIPLQIMLNRRNHKSLGSIFFSSRSVIQNQLGLKDSLDHYYTKPALLPEMEFLELRQHQAPKLKRIRKRGSNVGVIWKPNKLEKTRPPAYYAVYRFKDKGVNLSDLEEAGELVYVSPFLSEAKKFEFVDRTADKDTIYTYVVLAVNRQHTLSKASKYKRILKLSYGLRRIR